MRSWSGEKNAHMQLTWQSHVAEGKVMRMAPGGTEIKPVVPQEKYTSTSSPFQRLSWENLKIEMADGK